MATKTVSKWRQDKELAKISTSRKRPLEIEETTQSKASRLDVKIEPENEEQSAQMTIITETEIKRETNENNNRKGFEFMSCISTLFSMIEPLKAYTTSLRMLPSRI